MVKVSAVTAILTQICMKKRGYLVAQLVEALRYKLEGQGVRFPMRSLVFFIDLILLPTLWPQG
jgi:hypothetical protein